MEEAETQFRVYNLELDMVIFEKAELNSAAIEARPHQVNTTVNVMGIVKIISTLDGRHTTQPCPQVMQVMGAMRGVQRVTVTQVPNAHPPQAEVQRSGTRRRR